MSEPGFSHNTVQVLGAYAEAVQELWLMVELAVYRFGSPTTDDRAYAAARAAVRAARMLEVREEYR